MALQRYAKINIGDRKLGVIDVLNKIIDEYTAQGYKLTVRQLYYQMVARGRIENTVQSYKNLASIINDGRMCGLIDWDAIEDRTREFVRRSRWKSGAEIVKAAADSFHMDLWRYQDHRCFVVIEKEALAGVLEPICNQLDVPLLAARGYPSVSVLREFAETDLIPCFDFQKNGKPGPKQQLPVIIHLGDHDPSGIDMSRDLAERFYTFTSGSASGKQFGDNMFKRIALNMPQIEELKPPPNPAKQTDARFKDYEEKYGNESWELDALSPEYLVRIVRQAVERHIDKTVLARRKKEIEEIRSALKKTAERFEAEHPSN